MPGLGKDRSKKPSGCGLLAVLRTRMPGYLLLKPWNRLSAFDKYLGDSEHPELGLA